MKILLLSEGQSNAIGQGSGSLGASDLPRSARAWITFGAQVPSPFKLRPWHLFEARQSYDIPSFGRLWTGTDMACARALEDAGHEVHVIKAAFGASSLGEHWLLAFPSGYGLASEALFQLDQAFASRRKPRALGAFDLIVLLWDQSETDAMNDTLTTNYGANLATLISGKRAHSGLSALKCCIVQLHTSNPNPTRRGTIRSAQASFVSGDSGRSVLVDPSDLALDGDNLHRPAATRATLGRRAATSILTLA